MKKFEQVFNLWNQMSLASHVQDGGAWVSLHSEVPCPEGLGPGVLVQ